MEALTGINIQTARKTSNGRIHVRIAPTWTKKNTEIVAAMRSTSGKNLYRHPGSKNMVSIFFREKLFEYLSLLTTEFYSRGHIFLEGVEA